MKSMYNQTPKCISTMFSTAPNAALIDWQKLEVSSTYSAKQTVSVLSLPLLHLNWTVSKLQTVSTDFGCLLYFKYCIMTTLNPPYIIVKVQ